MDRTSGGRRALSAMTLRSCFWSSSDARARFGGSPAGKSSDDPEAAIQKAAEDNGWSPENVREAVYELRRTRAFA